MNKPRDNSASWAWHTRQVVDHECYADHYIEGAEDAEGPSDVSELRHAPERLAGALASRYARGDSIDELRTRYLQWLRPRFDHARALYQPFHPHVPLTLKFDQPLSWMMLMAIICFDEDGAMLTRPDDWFARNNKPLLYAMVLKGFVPAYRVDDSCNPRSKAAEHEAQVVHILRQPRDTWSGALDAYLRDWPALMTPHGYRDQLDDNQGPFGQFPMHVAAAVCAFDIDDSAFAGLPWYPHDLVAHYRTHLRHTRDAWRPADLDPADGLPEGGRSPGSKTPALSKSAAYARWVELVSGTPALCDAARKALGRRKTMPELFAVMQALAGVELAIQADIKDDETAQAQLLALCRARGLPAPELPEEPPHGPARISALFDALLDHAAAHGLTMVALDDQSDTWNVVLVATPSAGEFAALCERLEVGLLPDGGWD